MTPILLLAAAVLTASPVQAPAWTWSLYDGDGRLVLAEEEPSAMRLRTTLECEPGSGVARLTLFQFGATSGYAQFSAGGAGGAAEVASGRGEDLSLSLRIDHPAFVAFVADGRLDVSAGGRQRRIETPRPHLSRLRSFAEQCAG